MASTFDASKGGSKGGHKPLRSVAEDEQKYVERRLKLYITALPMEVNDDTFREHFSRYGPLVECSLIKPAVAGRQPFGFVTYKFAADCDAAAVNGQNFPYWPHPIIIKYQAEKEVQTRQTREEDMYEFLQTEEPTKIFIGGTQDWMDETELGNFFSQWGRGWFLSVGWGWWNSVGGNCVPFITSVC